MTLDVIFSCAMIVNALMFVHISWRLDRIENAQHKGRR